jgi:KipI family sensor histidine kinase inhibitor
MAPMQEARFEWASDQALLVSFGQEITGDAHRRVCSLLAWLQKAAIAGVLNLHPAYCSLLIRFDPRQTDHLNVERDVRALLARDPGGAEVAPREVEIPVCYGGDFGPDLAQLAKLQGLSVDEVIRLHSDRTYTVYFLGFVPGFAYLGTVARAIAAPRLSSPRRRVEAGSVGIAGRQTGVYPGPVPGGWRLVGRTPLTMFRPERDPMSLLAAGDQVRFRPIGEAEFARAAKGGA